MHVQQSILSGIKDRLHHHDFLVLPSFGGFVLRSMPSHIAASGNVLLPPAKTVGFNSQLKQNDGILSAWLQEKLACSQQEANQHLADFSAYCHGVLQAKRRLNLPGIGFFYLDFENNICFEPQQDVNFLSSSFGLGAVTLHPIEADKVEEPVKVKVQDRVITEPTPLAVKPSRSMRKIMVPLLLLGMFSGFVFLMVSSSSMRGKLQASLWSGSERQEYQPISYPPLSLQTPLENKKEYLADANGVAVLELADNTEVLVKAVETPANTVNNKEVPSVNKAHPFEIVLGCFSVRDNAERMLNKLKGELGQAYISDHLHKGMYVVSASGFTSKDQANSELSGLKSRFPHAWIRH